MRLRWVLGAMVVSAGFLGGAPASAAPLIPGQCEVPRDFPTLQSALDDPTCVGVHAREGVYTEQLTIRRSVTLAGSGERYTTIHAPASMADPKAIIRVTGRKVRVKIKHFTIQGPGAGGALVGIRVEKDATATVTNVIITDIRQEPMGSGADFIGLYAGVPGGPQITSVTLNNCTITGYQGAGVLIEGNGTIGRVTYSIIDGTGYRPASTPAPAGVVVRGGALVTVDHSDVNDNRAAPGSGTGVGILLQGAAVKTTVSQNNVDRNDVGIRVIGTDKAVIYQNGVDDATGDGIVLEQSDANLVSRNRVVSGGGAGILLSDSHANNVYTNAVMTNEDGGLVLEGSTNNLVTGNRADVNVGFGMTDNSTGTKTAGTANTWGSNVCNGNTLGDSSPAGLCQ